MPFEKLSTSSKPSYLKFLGAILGTKGQWRPFEEVSDHILDIIQIHAETSQAGFFWGVIWCYFLKKKKDGSTYRNDFYFLW